MTAMATIKHLDSFVLKDRLGLTEARINEEAQASATRRAETMGWTNVSVRAAKSPISVEGDLKCYSFEIWGAETQPSSKRQSSSSEAGAMEREARP